MGKNIVICTIQDVTKRHGSNLVLGPVSLTLRTGEVLGIRGANGAGKSTLLNIIAGITKADSGTVTMAAETRKAIGYVPQDIALYPSLSGKHNLEFWAGIYGLRGKQKEIRIRWLLTEVGLLEKADVPIQEYSGGMRRRLNLAAALLVKPQIFLLDEPTVGADYQSVEVMLTMMQHIKDQGAAVVFISHRDDELEKISNHIVTMEKGQIISQYQVPNQGAEL